MLGKLCESTWRGCENDSYHCLTFSPRPVKQQLGHPYFCPSTVEALQEHDVVPDSNTSFLRAFCANHSPTQAVHVMEDLGASDILVLNGDASGACGVGIESTVAKIDMANDRILILRMGGVTQNRIKEALDEGGEEFLRTSVHAGSVAGGKSDKDTERLDGGNDVSAEVGRADPQGQAPGIPDPSFHLWTMRSDICDAPYFALRVVLRQPPLSTFSLSLRVAVRK